MLAIGGLYFFVSNLSPEFLRNRAQQQTGDSMAQAREALIGYAIRFRDEQLAQGSGGLVYGYLPMPDLGTSRNNNAGCTEEGCEAANFAGNAANITVIGRFPWRSLGTGPLRDASGECLWYAVSGSHQRVQRTTPMNWDTLSQLDVVVASGTAALTSAIASAHDRPIAVIFSPGPALPGQNRAAAVSDSVTECGGNYDVLNYLDPVTSTQLAGITNYLAGSTNSASGDTSAASKSLTAGGLVSRRSDGALWSGTCPAGSADDCSVVSNDGGTTLTSTQLFQTLRGSSYFRTDINAMLERMTECLRDQIAAGGSFTPTALTGFTGPGDKAVGRIPGNACYDDTTNPLGYFSHYVDQLFVIRPNTGSLGVTLDGGTAQSCAAGLIFAGQRGTKNPAPTDGGESPVQLRTSAQVSATNAILNTNWPANYLEDNNLSAFTTTGALALSGNSTLGQVRASKSTSTDIARCTAGSLWKLDDTTCHLAEQDIVRCIPFGASLTTVESPNLSSSKQLVSYDAASSTLILGKENVVNSSDGAANLFGCAWLADARSMGSGLRSYFQFSFAAVLQPSGTTNVGNTGFVFAIIDSESNPDLPCGMAGNHLGFSGNNNFTPKVKPPKIGIEFDQSRNTGFKFDGRSESSTNKGRNDPCYTCASGTRDTHAAIVYWGHESTNTTDSVTLPDNDDNVHDYPTTTSLTGTRRPPKNPSSSPGIEERDLRVGGQVFHVRIEVTPTRSINAAAENSKTTMQTKVWILPDSATVSNQITAMKNTTRPMSELYSSFGATLSDSANIFDVVGSACSSGSCPTSEACGTDNTCYRQGLKAVRLGFTGSQRTQTQEVTISRFSTTWLP
jgi:hypothetical protein